MFFPKIRARAKWVVLFLAIAFAASFVLFGVGTGFGGLQDILLQEQAVGGGPSEETARERTEKNPRDAQAWRDLSTALLNKGEGDEAIQPLARYVALEPDDVDAKRDERRVGFQDLDPRRDPADRAAATFVRQPEANVLATRMGCH